MSGTTSTMPTLPPEVAREDRGPGLRACVIVMTVLATGSIVSRFWSRSLSTSQAPSGYQRRFWWDDWFALAATPFIFAQLAAEYWVLDLGFGRHLLTLPPGDLLTILKLIFTCSVLYGFELCLARASALFFLTRAFPRSASPAWFNITLMTTQALNVAWGLGTVIAPFLMCNPVEKNWNPMLPGTCAPMNRLWMGCTIPGVIIDFIILLLPMPNVWRLHSSLARKIGITIIFVMGYCVIIAALGRLITVVRPSPNFNTDITYEAVPMVYWFTVDPTITLVSICLPAMLPLGRYLVASYISPLASKVSSIRSPGPSQVLSTGKSSNSSRGGHSARRGPQRTESQDAESIDLGDSRVFHTADSDTEKLHISPDQDHYNAEISSGYGHNFGNRHFPSRSIRVDKDVRITR